MWADSCTLPCLTLSKHSRIRRDTECCSAAMPGQVGKKRRQQQLAPLEELLVMFAVVRRTPAVHPIADRRGCTKPNAAPWLNSDVRECRLTALGWLVTLTTGAGTELACRKLRVSPLATV